jgi:hypothetical protein
MTVSNTTARTSATGTNTAGQEIPFLFPINATSDLDVYQRVTATGVTTTLTLDTNYTVDIEGDIGGTVTMVAAVPVTEEVFIVRDTAATQTLDLEHGGSFSAENLGEALDRLTRLVIENRDAIARCIKVPESDSTTIDMELDTSVDRASQYVSFDSNGEPTVTSTVAPSTATVTAYMETVLDDADAATARTTLGVAIDSDVQAYDAALDDISALAVTDGNFIVADGANWVAESGATARTSMGAANSATVVNASEAVIYDDAVVTYDDEIVTYA